MPHTTKMSSANPGLIIFLIDQSGSMNQSFGEVGESKSDFAAKALNRAIYEIINANTAGEKVKDRCFVSIIGYGSKVKEENSGYLNELANNPLRIDSVKKMIPDNAGGVIEIDYQLPVWVEPQTGGSTPMAKGFEEAKYLIEKWIKGKPDTPAPIIINISDGLPNSDQSATDAAKEVLNLSSSDGNALIFNVHIGTSSSSKIIFPDNTSNFSGNDNAAFLFEISSEVPDSFLGAAEELKANISKGSKGYIFNADATDLVKFLQFGSSTALGQERIN